MWLVRNVSSHHTHTLDNWKKKHENTEESNEKALEFISHIASKWFQ